jgi:hypothetical protein
MPKRGKTMKEHFTFKSNNSYLYAFTIINIILMGFLLGLVTGSSDNVDRNIYAAFLVILCVVPIIILFFTGKLASSPAVKWVIAFCILIIMAFGIAYTQLSKPDVEMKVQVMTYFVYAFVCINWMFVILFHCKFCKSSS